MRPGSAANQSQASRKLRKKQIEMIQNQARQGLNIDKEGNNGLSMIHLDFERAINPQNQNRKRP